MLKLCISCRKLIHQNYNIGSVLQNQLSAIAINTATVYDYHLNSLLSSRYLPSRWRMCHCFHKEHLLPVGFFYFSFLSYVKFNSRFWLDKVWYLRQKEHRPEYDILSHLPFISKMLIKLTLPVINGHCLIFVICIAQVLWDTCVTITV